MIEITATNIYQTKLTEELLSSLPKEVKADLIETVEAIPFIKSLIQPESVRGYAKDRPRMDDGRIIVDVIKPHILTDMDYFRERAIFYDKHGYYTLLQPNPHPKSEYGKFWKEEVRRWKEGLVRESDGEWIPGYYYFYLNYSPIWINEEITSSDAKKRRRVVGVRKKEFPKVWLGDYLWFHYMDQARNGGLYDDFEGGKHCKLLKARGKGFSFKLASVSPCTMYVQPGLSCFHLASEKTYLEGDKGVFGKVIDCLDWVAETTPMPRLRLVDKPLEKQIGYKSSEGMRKGILSSVFGISMKDDADKARGIRGPVIHYEEDGVFDNLEDAWNVNLEAVESGSVTHGLMIAGGTGGSEGASFIGSEKLFYYPEIHHIYAIPNVFDKNVDPAKNKCGFFWGAYLNRSRCYSAGNGEPDVIGALIEIFQERFEIKYKSPDATALTQRKSEQPITPQEAVLRRDGTVFPVAELKERLADIAPNIQQFTRPHFVGDFVVRADGSVAFLEDLTKKPLRDFPIKDSSSKEGAVEIFEQPVTGHNGRVIPLRYIAGIDPVDDDHSTTDSLPSIHILDLFTDRIVMEYTGRPATAYAFYEKCRRALLYYNATANYENDKKGLYSYFLKMRCLNLLCDNPEVLQEKNLATLGVNYGNKKKGTNSSTKVNAWGRRLQADWLIDRAYGSDDDEPLLNLHKVRSIAYLKELIAWNPDGNFDRISAMGMLMIYREELGRVERRQKEDKVKTIRDDPFWDRMSKNSSRIVDKMLY